MNYLSKLTPFAHNLRNSKLLCPWFCQNYSRMLDVAILFNIHDNIPGQNIGVRYFLVIVFV